MKCANPYVRDKNGIIRSYLADNVEDLSGIPFPCGQCLPCRINKRRVWTCRMLLELKYHEKSSFVTLTYDNENLPRDLSLNKVHLQKYFKRLRKHGFVFRYYAVGEYGDLRQRPHYHVAFFGISQDELDLITPIWGMGRTHAGTLTPDSAQYVAGYILKKMTNKKDLRLNGRAPEFSLMSRRPALGLISIRDVANSLAKHPLFLKAMNNEQNVPIAVSTMGKKWPLGRYIRDKLYDLFKFYDVDKPLYSLRSKVSQDFISKKTEGIDFYLDLIEKGDLSTRRANFHLQPKGRDLNEI